MKHDPEYARYLTYQAQTEGVLPLTSRCNTRCLFCSHRQNPPGVEAVRLRPRSPEEIAESLSFMTGLDRVVVGESVTRVVEGEPFTHPHIFEILALVRHRLPRATLAITTNGVALDEHAIARLESMQPVEICLSLNSANPAVRKELLGDHEPGRALAALERLARSRLAFSGSVVAMPHLVGWEDLRRTVLLLARHGARTIRVFLPGFTRLAPESLRFGPELWPQLRHAVAEWRKLTPVPITLDPPGLVDLVPRVAGVIRPSPASAAGIVAEAVIQAVDGRVPRSRVEAFRLLERAQDPWVRISRPFGEGPRPNSPGATVEVQLTKEAGKASGVVMDYDFDPELAELCWGIIRRHRARRVLVLTSVLAEPLVRLGLGGGETPVGGAAGGAAREAAQGAAEEGTELRVQAVPNAFYGGSIMAAGLLVVDDFRQGARLADAARGPELVLLPGVAFDARGRDLTGHSYLELAEEWGVGVEIVP